MNILHQLVFICLFGSLLFLTSCSEAKKPDQVIKVHWELDSIQTSPRALSFISTTIVNGKNFTLNSKNWALHYNHIGGRPDEASLPDEIEIVNDNGDYFQLRPTSNFKDLPGGASRTYNYVITGHLDKKSETPAGMFAVIDGSPEDIRYSEEGIDEATLSPIRPTNAASRFDKNARLVEMEPEDLLPFVPRPWFYEYLDESRTVGKVVRVEASQGLENEVEFLKNGLSKLGLELTTTEGEPDILLALERTDDPASGAYTMRVDHSGIVVTGYDASGIFYGVQSLVQYLDLAQKDDNGAINVRGIEVEDQPRFDYRGMHLDVARNFHDVEQVKRLLDEMAYFKLNKFHFHLTDDEGWRLEIPGLPELTEIGSKRGYTKDETDHLVPSYGSGWDPEKSYGSGFYSRDEFIDLLQYADQRHIEVIAEIDVPAHARAAIKSMKVRYGRLSQEDEESASFYRLDDPDDASVYGSAQNWHDNVICVCRDGAYNFMEKVFSELVAMYSEANAPLTTIHVGGDEMPYGAWQQSPLCQEFIENNPELKSASDLPAYFFARMQEVMDGHGLITSGWEEMAIAHNEQGHDATDINPDVNPDNLRPYVWNAIMGGGREEMIYKLANAGFEVVMCNSSSFYFDMAYDRDPDEIGLSWSGFADTEKAFGVEPTNIFYRRPADSRGNALTADYLRGKTRLSTTGAQNFLGVQAQLWSETIRKAESIDYLVFPKILGFAQRAWSPPGLWMNERAADAIDKAYDREWNQFANTIGQKLLPLLDRKQAGIGYRIPEPGAVFRDGMIEANIAFPGLKIMYSKGGSGSPQLYRGPFEADAGSVYYLWSETTSGRNGRKTQIRT